VLVSHDRHMLEMTADRLVLVDGGTAKEFDGSLDDYIAFVLAGDKQPEAKGKSGAKKEKGKPIDRDADKARRKTIRDCEAEIAKLTTDRNAIDRAMFDPKTAEPRYAKLAMGELMKRRVDVQAQIEAAEATWLEATEALETA
jgi:ATP-binding cassette subfamily F protein 3